MNLINFLKSNAKTRKIFGQRELKIIEKQIWGIQLTQSEKNRLSRDIRKKLDFIREVSKYEGEFDLKKGTEIKKIIEKTKEEILNDQLRNKIEKILLFGSVVKNELTFRSDVDFAVIFDNITKKEAFKFRIRIHGRSSDKVDIQVFNILPKKIKDSIKKNNKVIYERRKPYRG